MLEQAKHIFDTFEYFWVDHKSKFFCKCLATRWRCDRFFQKSPKSKSDNTLTLKKLFVTPTFCKRNLSQLHHFRTVNYFTFKIALVWDCDWVRDCLKQSNFESKRIHNFKTVNPRQISLAEVRDNKRFFQSKSVVRFWFLGLLEKLIAVQNSPGHCITSI